MQSDWIAPQTYYEKCIESGKWRILAVKNSQTETEKLEFDSEQEMLDALRDLWHTYCRSRGESYATVKSFSDQGCLGWHW